MKRLSSSSLKSAGFTIVELLIVIVVIGILAAISIVAYNGIQNRTYDTAVKQDLSNVAKLMAQFKIDESGSRYPHTLATHTLSFAPLGLYDALPELKVSQSAYADSSQGVNQNFLYCRNGDWTNFAIVAQSKSRNIFYVGANGVVNELPGNWSTDPHSNCGAAMDGYFNLSSDGEAGNYDPGYWVGNGSGGSDWRVWANR